jgi:hypothetical protein
MTSPTNASNERERVRPRVRGRVVVALAAGRLGSTHLAAQQGTSDAFDHSHVPLTNEVPQGIDVDSFTDAAIASSSVLPDVHTLESDANRRNQVTAGLCDDSGQWLYNTGLPAKRGVGGGLIAVSPGKFGIAVVSPPLDDAGNSVRAQRAIAAISNALGGNPWAPTAR